MKFEELFKHKPGSVGAEMQKTINGLNEEIKQLRCQVANQAKLESENAKLKKELEWKTKRMKTLAEGLHGIEDVLKKTAASLFRDAVEDGSEDDPLEVENAALRADKERLDWLEQARPIAWALGDAQRGEYWILTDLGEKHPEESEEFATLRAAIDAARKDQP